MFEKQLYLRAEAHGRFVAVYNSLKGWVEVQVQRARMGLMGFEALLSKILFYVFLGVTEDFLCFFYNNHLCV